jgi:hypothetical protein
MKKAVLTKSIIKPEVGRNALWKVVRGELKRSRGRPGKVSRLFKTVAEKIPFEFLDKVKEKLGKGIDKKGVYIAHDSMGYPRYVGRGNIFTRLAARKKVNIIELSYFSFYIVENKVHEREIETIMIRAAGPLLDFNTKKVRIDISPGDIKDFEAGTEFYERQRIRGRKSVKKKIPKKLSTKQKQKKRMVW